MTNDTMTKLSTKPRTLILGATGMLGHKLCQLLPTMGLEVVATLRGSQNWKATHPQVFGQVELVPGVDVLDEARLEATLSQIRPEVIVNGIGIVKQKAEADDRYLSVAINSFLPHRLATWCAANGSRLIHVSTDCVFDGRRGAYEETDPSNALDVYGKSKFLGETTGDQAAAVTLRTSIIGRELHEPHHGLLEWFLAQRGGRCKGFAKAVYSGFTTHELAKIIRLVIDNPKLCGMYQVSSAPIDKFDLLQRINVAYGTRVAIARDEDFHCDRSLVMSRFSAETGYAPPDWDAMIREMQADATPYDAWLAQAREIDDKWNRHAFKSC